MLFRSAGLRHGQALITLPRCSASLQQELLVQSLAGVRSVLPLIGGHTLQALESSDPSQPLAKQLSLGLVVNGQLPHGQNSWGKGPLRPGDALLLSRPIGTGVLFAAAQAIYRNHPTLRRTKNALTVHFANEQFWTGCGQLR